MLKFNKEKALILVICQDNGEVAVELLNRSGPDSKLFMITRNENHRKAITSTLERLQIPGDQIQLLKVGLDRYTKSRPREKFTHFYLEMPSTETGKRPNPYFDLEEKVIISNARAQFSALRGISLVGQDKAQIAYVTHSIDPSENQEVIIQAFRQGNFSPVNIPEQYVQEYPLELNALPEIPTVTQSSSIDLEKFEQERVFSTSWLKVDPRVHKSDAGFVANLKLQLR